MFYTKKLMLLLACFGALGINAVLIRTVQEKILHNAVVRKVTARGLYINHSDGSGIFKPYEIDPAYHKFIQPQIDQYVEILLKAAEKSPGAFADLEKTLRKSPKVNADLRRRYEVLKQDRQKKRNGMLEALLAGLPSMTQAEIENWAGSKVRKKVTDPEFHAAFTAEFGGSPNCKSALDAIFRRLTSIQNGELETLRQNCLGKDNKTIDALVSQKIGTAPGNFDEMIFARILEQKYPFAGSEERENFIRHIWTQRQKNIEAERVAAEERKRAAEEEARRRAAEEEARKRAEEEARRIAIAEHIQKLRGWKNGSLALPPGRLLVICPTCGGSGEAWDRTCRDCFGIGCVLATPEAVDFGRLRVLRR